MKVQVPVYRTCGHQQGKAYVVSAFLARREWFTRETRHLMVMVMRVVDDPVNAGLGNQLTRSVEFYVFMPQLHGGLLPNASAETSGTVGRRD